MPGRRQPTAVVEANGKKHLSQAEKEERRSGEVNACTDKTVRAPKWLPEKLRKDFNDISKRLIALGIFCKLDRDTLGRYLVAHDAWVSASQYAAEAIAAKDADAAAEWSSIQDRYFKQCRACAGDLGLTITSRCTLVIPQKSDAGAEQDPFLRLIERRKKA